MCGVVGYCGWHMFLEELKAKKKKKKHFVAVHAVVFVTLVTHWCSYRYVNAISALSGHQEIVFYRAAHTELHTVSKYENLYTAA